IRGVREYSRHHSGRKPMSQTRRTAAALLVGLVAWSSVGARESNGTPTARRLLAQGDAAARTGKLDDAVAAFRKAIDADADFVEAHQRLIETSQRLESPGSRTPAVPRLQALYERWARAHPRRAVYQWALGFISQDPNTSDS